MEQNINTEAPTVPVVENKQKSGNGLKIATAIACIAAVCGIGFGIYGMIQSSQKDDQISDLKVQIEDSNGKVTTLETDEIKISDDSQTDSTVKKQNPVISATAPMIYNIYFKSGTIGYGENGEFSLSLNIHNGEISECNVNSVDSKWVGGNDGGIVSNTRFLKNCSINGITGKIYKVVEVGEGHDALYDSVAFIMEDGSVEYLSLNDALEKSDFNIKGKLKIDGFVVDAFTIGVGQEGAPAGGYGSTIFVLADGSYVKYDTSMLN